MSSVWRLRTCCSHGSIWGFSSWKDDVYTWLQLSHTQSAALTWLNQPVGIELQNKKLYHVFQCDLGPLLLANHMNGPKLSHIFKHSSLADHTSRQHRHWLCLCACTEDVTENNRGISKRSVLLSAGQRNPLMMSLPFLGFIGTCHTCYAMIYISQHILR